MTKYITIRNYKHSLNSFRASKSERHILLNNIKTNWTAYNDRTVSKQCQAESKMAKSTFDYLKKRKKEPKIERIHVINITYVLCMFW